LSHGVGHAPHAISISVATGLIGKVELPHFTPTEELIPMTDDRLPLAELMAKTGDGDFLRTIAESVLQIIMEADVDGLVGWPAERSGEARPGAMATVTAASIPGSARST
jgi:hypothetical protein